MGLPLMRASGATGSNEDSLPAEIYVSAVASLYSGARSLVLGSLMVTGAVLLTYEKTGNLYLLGCAVALGIVAVLRGLDMRAFAAKRPDPQDQEAARGW
ncbi:MAG: hypothetical protein JO048_13120, partial [Methylobacteriaceae bacterium]|nr:hypothetical protein [Methylobacteriaceae bacterium]